MSSRPLPPRPSAERIAALAEELSGADASLELLQADQPAVLERFSRDFFDYSPVLVAQLQEQRAQLVARITTVEQVQLVAGACCRHGVPLTVRGAGTGNYGQCVPLRGGLVLDLTPMNRLRRLDPLSGVLEVEAGVLMGDLERRLADQGRALRLVPSTVRSATIGGFIAGGSGGIGSLRWGFLRDPGNLLGLEIVTMEPEPRLLQLDAAASAPLNHAYGTNGILTALRLPSTEAVDWRQLVVGFGDWDQALAAAQTLPRTAFELNSLTLLEDDVAMQMPWPVGCSAPNGEHRLLLLAAPAAMEALPRWLEAGGGQLLWQSPQSCSRGIPLRELGWNHTTLHWRAGRPGWTYLQLLLPQPEGPCLAELRRRWGEAIRWHLEAVKHQGAARLACLPLLLWQGDASLQELIAHCRELGAFLFNPHVLTVEDGGLGVVDADQVAAKHAYDPMGLLNPGKLRGWLEGH
ncbi:FAD-binding oxidoreductase [Synechococcus sp. GFB01]|uniref:FAD-binding oxidoreductase n=1 Tax=Synechococcus sp. GFB01 TaxID=1662190 RepID=UPI00064E9F86|nr:FAD-binding oxidoreductase [Synechococcus sp. GFB01]KMM16953.1 FAD-binding protein [Synechococcus sp. GFB01]